MRVLSIGCVIALAAAATACGEGNPLQASAPSAITPSTARADKVAAAGPNLIIWGEKLPADKSDLIIWGEGVGADNIMWGEHAPVSAADNILWGDKAPKAGTHYIIWGDKAPKVGGRNILWGDSIPIDDGAYVNYDGNNGGGNDAGKVDPSNPGKGNKPTYGAQYDLWGYDDPPDNQY